MKNRPHHIFRKATSRAACAAFTLLEVLIALLLATTLMAGVWGLASVYTQLFETGVERVEEAQLVRSLNQLIADDVLCVVQTTPREPSEVAVLPLSARAARVAAVWQRQSTSRQLATNLSDDSEEGGEERSESFESDMPSETEIPTSFAFATSTSLPRFGLVGTSQSLQIAALQPTLPIPSEETLEELEEAGDPFEEAGDPFEEMANEFEATPIVRAPELRLVAYSFEAPYEPMPNERRPPAGLLRREMDWETAIGLAGMSHDSSTSSGFGQPAMAVPLPSVTETDLDTISEEESGGEFQDEAITLVPEVVGLEFRYFDGQTWSSQWDSWQREALPVAIEVTFHVMSAGELDEIQSLYSDDTEEMDQELQTSRELERTDGTNEEATDEAEMQEPTGRIYRQLIYLPAGPRPNEQSSSGSGTRTR